jgi:hypothetical protein
MFTNVNTYKESQQMFCDTLKKVGSTIQSVVNDVVGEVEKEVSKAIPVMKKVADDVSKKVKEEIKVVREDATLGKIINEVSKSIEKEKKKDEDWTFIEQSKSEPVKIDIEVVKPKEQAVPVEIKVEEKPKDINPVEEKKEQLPVEEKKEQPKEELKPVPHELLAARFIKDITIEDNAEIACGVQFEKVWRIQNTGNVAWPEGVCLEYLGGSEEMGMFLEFTLSNIFLGIPLKTRFPAKPAKVGEEVDISVPLVAPTKPGVYKGYFRLTTPQGEQFGHRVYFNIVAISTPEPKSEPKEEKAPELKPVLKEQPKPQPQKWEKEIKTLIEMGFTEVNLLTALLDKNNGDISRTVQEYLGGI